MCNTCSSEVMEVINNDFLEEIVQAHDSIFGSDKKVSRNIAIEYQQLRALYSNFTYQVFHGLATEDLAKNQKLYRERWNSLKSNIDSLLKNEDTTEEKEPEQKETEVNLEFLTSDKFMQSPPKYVISSEETDSDSDTFAVVTPSEEDTYGKWISKEHQFKVWMETNADSLKTYLKVEGDKTEKTDEQINEEIVWQEKQEDISHEVDEDNT